VLWPDRSQRSGGRGKRSAQQQDQAPEQVEEERAARAPRTRPRRPRPLADDAAALPTSPAEPTAAPIASVPRKPVTRVEELQLRVMQEAVRHDWVTLDDHDNPCPPDKIRIVYDVPADLKGYTKGAYFEPLGPAPGESTDEVNGLLLCEGSTFLYRGFEAYWRADRGQWDVFPFPVIE
jgi:hypothetical protein